MGLDELAQLALGEHGVVDAKAGEFNLTRLGGQTAVFHHPVVERAVRFKLQ